MEMELVQQRERAKKKKKANDKWEDTRRKKGVMYKRIMTCKVLFTMVLHSMLLLLPFA